MNPRDFDPPASLPTLAARLKPEEAARVIGCQPHDIPILVRLGLLKPLGRPPVNAVKYFSRQRVLDLCSKDSWLVQVSDALVQHWQGKNLRRRIPVASVLPVRRRSPCPVPPRNGTGFQSGEHSEPSSPAEQPLPGGH